VWDEQMGQRPARFGVPDSSAIRFDLPVRPLLPRLLGVLAAVVMICWRMLLRVRLVDDPRPALKAAGRRYVYAILHAHQLSFILLSDDVPILAMVSASSDGDWLVPLCRVRRIVPVRGSTHDGGFDKGGRAALALLADGVRAGLPALLAVDGPRGPRNSVHWGIVDLARETDACIVVAGVFLPTSRSVLERTWDRTQLPRPFSTLTGRFRPPIDPRDFRDRAALRAHVAAELLALEQTFDSDEARYAGRVQQRSRRTD
jgi:lysophospholipid acyltransferase (LPLAT)-like uncharacterized protein